MAPRAPLPDGVIRGGLAGAAVLAGLALIHTLFLSRTPQATEPALSAFAVPGYRLSRLPGEAGQQGRDQSHGTVTRFSARRSDDAGPSFTLAFVSLRSRTPEGLGNADLGVLPPSLRLKDHRALKTDGPGTLAMGSSEAGPTLQTCVVAGGHAGITGEQLALAIDLQRTRENGTGAAYWLGLTPRSRWECLLVSLSSPPSPTAEPDLLALWQRLAPSLGGLRAAPGP